LVSVPARWRGGGYGFVTFDGAEIHLGVEPDLDTRADRRSTAYLFVGDADALARTWLAAGGDVRLPQDTEWGQHEGVLVDPDGNVIRAGHGRPNDARCAPKVPRARTLCPGTSSPRYLA
jgi:hypothetical protein